MILFQDIDGCLNTEDGAELGFDDASLSAAQANALRNLGRAIDDSPVEQVVLNTGRGWPATAYIGPAIASSKLRYALVEHGAQLWDLHNHTLVDLDELAARSKHPRALAALASTRRITGLIDWFADRGAVQLSSLLKFDGVLQVKADKTLNLTFAVPPQVDGDAAVDQLRLLVDRETSFAADGLIYHYSRSNRFIDVMGTMDKGLGVHLTVDYLAGEMSRTAAIGDGLNDLPMLEAVAVPVCPANAEPAVQDLCERRGYRSAASWIGAGHAWLDQFSG